jgi:Tfp pilus assembly protein PilF
VPERSAPVFFYFAKKIAHVVGLALLVASAVLLGRFLLEKLERRQSRQLAAQAAQDLMEGRMPEARMALETATRLDPGNTRALRLLAPVLEAGGAGSEALGTMARLAQSGGMTGRDLLDYTAMALRQEEFELARRVADASSTGTDPALRHLLLARVAIASDKPVEAERELRAAVEIDSSGRARLELARFLISRGLNAETRPEALELLRGVSVRPDPMGVEALFIELTGGAVPIVELDAWIAALRAHPAAGGRHLQVADMAEANLHPKKKTEVARNAARRLRGQPLAVRLEAMDWLLGIDEPKTALELLAPAEAAKDPRVFAVWLNALARSGDWSGARARLDQGNEPAPAYVARLFEGRGFLEQGDLLRARESWDEALREARGDRGNFLCALGFLGVFGEPDLFESGLREALAEHPDHREAVIAAVLPERSCKCWKSVPPTPAPPARCCKMKSTTSPCWPAARWMSKPWSCGAASTRRISPSAPRSASRSCGTVIPRRRCRCCRTANPMCMSPPCRAARKPWSSPFSPPTDSRRRPDSKPPPCRPPRSSSRRCG